MKKIFLILSCMSLWLGANQEVPSLHEHVLYTCERCNKKLARSEISFAILLTTKGCDPHFICDACRALKRGKGDLAQEALGYRPVFGIVNRRELDGGYRDSRGQSAEMQQLRIENHFRSNRIAVATPSGYRVVAQRHGKLPYFLVQPPHTQGYKMAQLPTMQVGTNQDGGRLLYTLPVEEMTPLPTNNVIVHSIQKSDGTALLYLYNPRKNTFKRLKDGELLKEMERCDKVIQANAFLREWFEELRKKKKAKDLAEEAKRFLRGQVEAEKKKQDEKLLSDFFDSLLAKAQESRS